MQILPRERRQSINLTKKNKHIVYLPITVLWQLNKSDVVLAFIELIDKKERYSTSERDVGKGKRQVPQEETKMKPGELTWSRKSDNRDLPIFG